MRAAPMDTSKSKDLDDIDPGWQPPGEPEPEAQALTAGTNDVPSVLKKLQKWGDYEPVGSPVWPTRFIPMKTPLSKELLRNWTLPEAPKHSLTVKDVLAFHQEQGKHIGCILDLSNHECLYTDDIPANIEYQHIRLIAKELPPQEFIDQVISAANKFWRRNSNDYIAIHCAYGFNRTGFAVCCYLIEECGLSVEDALESFSHSRPPGVKHEQFRRELHRRYDSLRVQRDAAAHGGAAALSSSPPDDNSSFGCSPGSRESAMLLSMGMSKLAVRRLHSSSFAPGAGVVGGHMHRSQSALSVQTLTQGFQRTTSSAFVPGLAYGGGASQSPNDAACLPSTPTHCASEAAASVYVDAGGLGRGSGVRPTRGKNTMAACERGLVLRFSQDFCREEQQFEMQNSEVPAPADLETTYVTISKGRSRESGTYSESRGTE